MNKQKSIIDKSHYKINGVDLIQSMKQGLVSREEYVGFLKGNIMKYVVRCEYKNDVFSDLDKAMDYLNRLYEFFKEEEIKSSIISNNDFIEWDINSCDCSDYDCSQCCEKCAGDYTDCGCDGDCDCCGSDILPNKLDEMVDEMVRREKIHKIAQILKKYGEDNE